MNACGTRLGAISKQLYIEWQQTKDSWGDAKSQEFDTRFLQELFTNAEKTVAVIEQLDKLISKIKKDCE
jgi:hypothetical protein